MPRLASAPTIRSYPQPEFSLAIRTIGFDGGIDLRTARVEAALGAAELASDQAPVPSQNGVGFGDTGHLGEMLTPQPLADFRQSGALWIGETQTPRKMGSEDAILGDQVFILEGEALVHQARHICQQPRPFVIAHG